MNNLFAKLSLLLLAGITTNLYAQEPTPTASAQETAEAPAAEESAIEDANKVDMAAATKIDPTVEAGNDEAAAKADSKMTEATEEKSEDSEDSQEEKAPKKAKSSKHKTGKKRHGGKHGKHGKRRAPASHPKQTDRPDVIEALQHRQSNASCPAACMVSQPTQPAQHMAPSMCSKGGCSM